jgi:nucleoside phosphorylase
MARRSALAVLALLAETAHAAGGPLPPADPFCAARVRTCLRPPFVAVLSAFPAELQPLLAAADVTETVATGERAYHLGRLAGARVVLVRSGIGLVNAAAAARGVLDRFRVSTLVFSGVAGSGLDIGDVAVPAEWTDHVDTFPVDRRLLAVARTLAAPPVPLEQCVRVPADAIPPAPAGSVVCLDHLPRIVVGGHGESSGNAPFPCTPGGGPVFGCDEDFAAAAAADATDMETAAVARVARDARVPFIGFRGVSDGGGDPLGLPGFPTQFFAYYPLAADNAAATTIAFLEASRARRARRGGTPRPGTPRVRAACDWPRAAGPVCAGDRVPHAATRRVAGACALLAEAARADPGSAAAAAAENRAHAEWRRAARLVARAPAAGLGPRCRHALVGALRSRAAVATRGIAPRAADRVEWDP